MNSGWTIYGLKLPSSQSCLMKVLPFTSDHSVALLHFAYTSESVIRSCNSALAVRPISRCDRLPPPWNRTR